jgi:MoaA/NifB/PqqE/SkfB family radical SAM enzyme
MLQKMQTAVALALGRKAPFSVAHHVTYRCNLNCDMCALKMMASVEEMATDACLAMQEDFRNHGTLVWEYSGGEPLVREDLEQLVCSAKSLGMRTIVHTNGVLIPQRPRLCGLADMIEMGVDGGRQAHDALRGSGTFDKAVAGLEALARLRSRRPRTTILTILNTQSITPGNLDEMVRLALEYDARVSFTLAAAHRIDDRPLKNARRFTPSAEQFREFRMWFEREKAGPRGRALQDDPAYFSELGEFPDFPLRIPCQAGLRRCVVEPTGLVLPCADMFTHPVHLLPRGSRFGYGYAGFMRLPNAYPCGKTYCYTAKTNFILATPWRILKHYYLP